MATTDERMTLREAAVFYASVMRHVLSHYVEDISIEKLLDGALRGMLNSLDPNSDYLTPQQYEELKSQTAGKYNGIGIELTSEDGIIKIVSPIDDTPAFLAGLKPADMIIKVNDKSIFGMNMREVVNALKGEPGTCVKVTIRRQNVADFDVHINRAVIDIEPVKSAIKDDVIYLRISTFNHKTTKHVKAALEKHMTELGNKARGVILDVRNNAGGLLEEAVSTVDLFLEPDHLIVSIKGKNNSNEVKFFSQGHDLAQALPLAVIINAASASSSEILAGAIKGNRRGRIIGIKSFGKGSVQKVVPLSNGGAVKLTEALYYTPDGQSIQAKGIEPNIVIPEQAPKEACNVNQKYEDYLLEQSIAILKGIEAYNHLN